MKTIALCPVVCLALACGGPAPAAAPSAAVPSEPTRHPSQGEPPVSDHDMAPTGSASTSPPDPVMPAEGQPDAPSAAGSGARVQFRSTENRPSSDADQEVASPTPGISASDLRDERKERFRKREEERLPSAN